MYRVGLTGGIGSGKTTVANLFSKFNITVIDTDVIARQLLEPTEPAYQIVIQTFGEEILQPDRSIDRKKLSQLVFNDSDKKKQLENILHPLIWVIVEQQVSVVNNSYCIIVVPLLFEGKHQSRFNCTLVVDSSEEEQVKRVLSRDQRTQNEIKAIMSQQISRDERIKLADDIILNNDSLEKLEQNVASLHQKYLSFAKAI